VGLSRRVLAAHDTADVTHYRRAHEKIDEVRIELRAPSLHYDLLSGFERTRMAVRARFGDSIEGVDNRDNAGFDRDRAPAQSAWISFSVPSLMMRENSVRQLRKECAERTQHVGPTPWVHHDGAPLFRRQFLRLLHDVGYRLVDFSNVVEQRNPLNAVQSAFVEIRCAPKRQRILRDATDMRARLGVVRIDRVEQALERCSAERASAIRSRRSL